MIKVVVTGANGMLGKAIQRAFINEHKYEILQYGRANSDLSTLEGLIKFREFINNVKPWYVIHTASVVGGIDMNNEHPYVFNMKNTFINAGVVDACVQNNVPRFLGILSVCCYGDGYDESEFPLTEDKFFLREPHPTNRGYAYSKRGLATHIISANKEFKREYNYIIPSNLYGEQDFRGYRAHFCSVMVDKVLNALRQSSNNILFEGDGRVKRQYVYADDFAKCIKQHVKNDINDNYNFASEEELSAEDMIKILLKELNMEKEISYVFKNTMVAGQFKRTVSVEKFRSLHPNFTFTPFSVGVKRMFDAFKE